MKQFSPLPLLSLTGAVVQHSSGLSRRLR
jgi:hypothetical protein